MSGGPVVQLLRSAVHLLAILALATLTVTAGLAQEWLAAAVALAGLVAVSTGVVLSVLVAVVAVAAGHLLVGAAVAAAWAARALDTIARRIQLRNADRPALTALVAELPDDLLGPLREIAGEQPISTIHVIKLARNRYPGTWRAALRGEPTTTEDGPPIPDGHGGRCTQYMAESVGIARALATTVNRPLDADILGAAAAMAPMSAGARWTGHTVPQALGVTATQKTRALASFAGTRAGRGMEGRITLMGMLPDWLQAEDLVSGGMRPSVTGLSSSTPSATPRASSPAVTAPRVSATPALVAPTPISTPTPAPEPSVVVSASSPPVPAPGPVAPVLAPARRPAAPAPGPRVARRDRDPHLRTSWAGLPAPLHGIWLVAGPLLALAAVVVAAVVDGLSWMLIPVLLATTRVHGLRAPFLPLLVVAAWSPFCPVAAVVLLARWALVEGGLRSTGSRARGVEAIVEARRDLAGRFLETEVPELQVARAQLPGLAQGDLFNGADVAVGALAAGWAEMRWGGLAGTFTAILRGVLFGDWGEGQISSQGRLLGGLLVDAGLDQVLRVTSVFVAVIGALVLSVVLEVPGGDGILERWLVPAVVSGLVAQAASREKIRIGRLVFAVGLAVVVLGNGAVAPLAVGGGVALAVNALRPAIKRWSLLGLRRQRSWPAPTGGSRRTSAMWNAAERAYGEGRPGMANQTLEDLAADPANAAIAAECRARMAAWALEAGRLSQAATLVEGLRGELSPHGHLAVARTLEALDQPQATAEHARAALGAARRRSAVSLDARLLLAEMQARLKDAQGALATLRERAPVLGVGVPAMIETEVAVAAALARDGETERALSHLDQLTEMALTDEPSIVGLGNAVARAVEQAEGRALLLKGRLTLEQRRPEAAADMLLAAANRLSQGHDEHARAAALVLRGRALADTTRWADAASEVEMGTAVLEHRRVQLQSSDRRTALIVANADLYRSALDVLYTADRRGVPGSGLQGAILIESLRRSAISQVLRSAASSMGGATARIATEINDAERDPAASAARVGELREDLARHVSADFAAAYLPSAVTAEEITTAAVESGNVLSFWWPENDRTLWRSWVTADGHATLDAVEISDGHVLAELEETSVLYRPEVYGPWDPECETWSELAEALLPPSLREAIAARSRHDPLPLMVIPDGAVAAVPWAALAVAEEPLVQRAIVQLVPTVDLAASALPPSVSSANVVFGGSEEQRKALRTVSEVVDAPSQEAFRSALGGPRVAGAFVRAHGEEVGYAQRIFFEDGSALSAAGALALKWPEWTVFASCVVGRIDPAAGREPLGLPISCMLGGSTCVMGAVVELTGVSATQFLAGVVASLVDHESPGAALRRAQLAVIDEDDLAGVSDCLGAVCISTRRIATS